MELFSFMKSVRECLESESRSFIRETLSNGSCVRSFVRSIGVNPVTGVRCFVVVVLEVV